MTTGLYRPPPHLPTWLALLVLIMGVGVSVVSLQKTPGRSFTRATTSQLPTQIEITNITSSTFTVSWITSEKTIGFVKYGVNQEAELIARDTRDPVVGDLGSYYTHWVTVSGLNPQSSYAFFIFSGGAQYGNNSSPYTVTTAVNQTEIPLADYVIKGQVITTDNQPANGALVYLRAIDMSPMSAMVDASGNWSISLANARTYNQTTAYNPSKEGFFEVFIQGGGPYPNTMAVFYLSQAQTLTPMTLGQDYDFRPVSASP